MRLKKTSQTTDLVLALFLYIPVVWAALLIAQSLGGGLPELLSNLTAALEQPFQIQWTDKSLLSILVGTGAYLMGLCLYASGQGRTRDGEEHGSAAWGSPRQLNAQFRQKQNKILTRHVRLGLDTHKHRRSLNVLVIGGSGAMYDYASQLLTPWADYRHTITAIEIGAGITHIGNYAFKGTTNCKEVVFAEGSQLKTIGSQAFHYNSALTSVRLPDTVTVLKGSAFGYCANLRDVYIPDGVFSMTKTTFQQSPNAVLSVAAGSYAENYAKQYGIPYTTR